MVRHIYFFIFLLALIACGNDERIDGSPALENEEVSVYYDKEDGIALPTGFSADTITDGDGKAGNQETYIFPVIDTPGFEQINKFLREEIRKATYSGKSVDTAISVDSLEEAPPVVVENIPITIYRSRNLVSYGYLRIMFGGGMMRPYREYFVINYDTTRGKMLRFDDYFQLGNAADVNKLKSLIYTDAATPEFEIADFQEQVEFSFDRDHVYFFFDQFGPLGNPMGFVKQVKKEYLSKFIRDAYK